MEQDQVHPLLRRGRGTSHSHRKSHHVLDNNLTDAFAKQGSPFGFRRIEVDIPGLSDQELVLPVLLSTIKTYLLTLDALDAL